MKDENDGYIGAGEGIGQDEDFAVYEEDRGILKTGFGEG